jgi:hypothetical protein
MLVNSLPSITRFGMFDVNVQTWEPCQTGQKVKLQEQPLQVFAALLERTGEVVTRRALDHQPESQRPEALRLSSFFCGTEHCPVNPIIYPTKRTHTAGDNTMKTIAITKPRGVTTRVLALLFRTSALSCVLFASSPLSADVWVAGDGRIAKVATNGRVLVTVDSVFGRGFQCGTGMQDIIGVDQSNGNVWVSDVNNNRVFELDANGKPLRETTLFSPFGIGIDPNSGAVWTSIAIVNKAPFQRAVIKLDLDTGEELVRVTGFSGLVAAVKVGRSGQVWIVDSNNNQVVVVFGTDEELNGYDASAPSGPHHLRLGGLLDRSIPIRVCGSPILAPEILGAKTLWEPRNQRGCLVVMFDSYFSGYSSCTMPLGSSKEPLRALFSLPGGLAHGNLQDITQRSRGCG